MADVTEPGAEQLLLLRERVNKAIAEAHALLVENRSTLADVSEQNEVLSGKVGTSLVMLCLCGSAAGLLAGLGVARSVTRSIEQLGGSVQTMAQTLGQERDDTPLQFEGLRDLLGTMSAISDKTVGMVSELERSRQTAERADQMAAVGQLAAGIAHELRNPLTAVKLLLDSAAEDSSQGLPESDLLVVQQEVGRMNQMLQGFLDFARPPKMQWQVFDLAEVVNQSLELVKPRAARQGVQVSDNVPGPVPLSGDPQQIRQVLINLLFNAIDAQPDGGAVTVALARAGEGDPARCVVTVADEGAGIAEEVAHRLFEPFVSTKETGVGLGLAVCDRIVRSHGGTIEAANRMSGGAVFTLRLPPDGIGYERNGDSL